MVTVTLSPRQHQILGALSRIITKEGFEELTVAVLADRLQCSRRTLYTLAPSRDSLVVGVVGELFDGWLERARSAAAASRDDVSAVVAFLAAGLDVGDATPPFFTDVDAHPDTAIVHERFRQDYMSDLKLLVDRARPAAGCATIDVPIVAEVLSAAVRRLAQLSHSTPPRLSEDDAAAVLDDLVRSWFRCRPH